jgi:Rrf2 family nitric oxide-sensitive transcriptional repressor
MYLAVDADRSATIGEIARAYDISETHLMKVVHQLGVAGDIETTRGRKGGMRLARPAADINLGAIVRRTETDMALVACFEPGGSCAIGGVCALSGILAEALAAFLAVLDQYTLTDLVKPRRGLAALFGIQPPRPSSPIETVS